MNALEARNLVVRYGSGRRELTAVDQVSFAVPAGSTMGLVGESGSGKSTVARAIVKLVSIVSGEVVVNGIDVSDAKRDDLRRLRRTVQLVFQDPMSSLNPRMTVGAAIEEVLTSHHDLSRADRQAELERLFDMANLDATFANRYPHQLSGGQRQRVAIIRALAVRPDVLIADEITSSLDVSVQAGVLNMLRQLQQRLGLTVLFIGHDLSVVRYMSDTVAVMFDARIVEHGRSEDLFERPSHPYTRELIDAIPSLQRRHRDGRAVSAGHDVARPATGCRFHNRCPVGPRSDSTRVPCEEEDPVLRSNGETRSVACHFPLNDHRL